LPRGRAESPIDFSGSVSANGWRAFSNLRLATSARLSNVFWDGFMKLPRRRQFLHLAAGVAVLPAVSRLAWAQAYPSQPITMIVPFPAGGGTEVVARILAGRMKEALGQPIIVENVSGASGNIGVARLARAKPDGYTIDRGHSSPHGMNGALYSLPYDVLNDFEPISPVVTVPLVLFARRTMPANDLVELIAWLKANPNRATTGIYTAGINLITALFQKEIRTQLAFVPYRGASPAMQDLVAGQIDMFLTHWFHFRWCGPGA
jgi:tripartite-type tricarboxylate transporter receptor subunit TctC